MSNNDSYKSKLKKSLPYIGAAIAVTIGSYFVYLQYKKNKNQIKNIVTPIKSENDKNDYRIITLKNNLECILISDKLTKKAACALSVNVGSWEDPSNPLLPGLAHFLEHMLFLGTKKYPNENAYNQYIKDHGGRDNAATGCKYTCYQFDIDAKYLSGGIDRFVQFFIDPLFTASCTNRELDAVDAENSKNLQNDARRLYQFDRSLSLKTHPWHKFGTGNRETLKHDNLRQHLIKFHSKYYKSSIMKLAVYGKESLDELQDIVINNFSDIKDNSDIKDDLNYSKNVYDLTQFPALYKIIPIKEQRILKVCWILDDIPSSVMYNARPLSIISSLLGDETKGSILQYLKENNLATALSAGTRYEYNCFIVFQIRCSLTINGLDKWNEIILTIFQYINYIQNNMNDNEWIRYFNERKKIGNIYFKFKSQSKAYGYATSLSKQLIHDYNRKLLLKQSSRCYLTDQCDIDLYKRMINKFNVNNMYIALISKDFDEKECDQKEIWYGTQYKKENINDTYLNDWINCDCNDNKELYIPRLNKYISDDFSLFSLNKEAKEFEEAKETPPVVLHQTNQMEIWYKMDEIFCKPKLYVTILLHSPVLNDNCLSKLYTRLIIRIINNELSQYTYSFQEAGLYYNISYYDVNVIRFVFWGYNQKLHLLSETVLKLFTSLSITKIKYETQHEKLKRSIESMTKQQPYRHCSKMINYLLIKNSNSLTETIEIFKQITFEGTIAHFQNIFNKIYITSFIYGNCNQNSIKPYIKYISEYFCDKSNDIYSKNDIIANDKTGCLNVCDNNVMILPFNCPNKEDKNSCCKNIYFHELDSNQNNYFNNGILSLFSSICKSQSFDQLRTKEQLGYIVWSYNDTYNGLLCFSILIQSNKKLPNYLNKRIEIFLDNFRNNYLNNLTAANIELNKQSLINNLLEKPKNLENQYYRYLYEIHLNRFDWKRRTNIANSIKQMKQNDLLNFYDKYLSINNTKRSKISIQCVSNKMINNDDDDDKTNTVDNDDNKDNDNNDGDDNKDDDNQNENIKNMEKYEQQFQIKEQDILTIRDKYGYLPYPWNRMRSNKTSN